jgi:hypothetical protein
MSIPAGRRHGSFEENRCPNQSLPFTRKPIENKRCAVRRGVVRDSSPGSGTSVRPNRFSDMRPNIVPKVLPLISNKPRLHLDKWLGQRFQPSGIERRNQRNVLKLLCRHLRPLQSSHSDRLILYWPR